MPAKTATPLRYPGGKAKLINYTKEVIRTNNLIGCTYVEPFAGGAGLAIQLLLDGVADRLILNDIDRSVFAVWNSILNNTAALIEMITKTDITIQEWHRQKEVQVNKENCDLLELGFSTLFLNRTNRSGILGAGPIGGKNQNGNYKLDCRFDKFDIITRINRIAAERNKIEFYNHDATYFINNIINPLNENVFIFFDPPYHIQGPGLYLNHFNDEDHELLSRVISNVRHPWLVTYDNTDFIQTLYNHFTQTTYSLNYSAQKTQIGTELMIYSNNVIQVPITSAH